VDRPVVASALHGRIQDGFNGAGLQIMSPHYVFKPRNPVLGETPPAEPSRTERPATAGGIGR